MGTMTQKFLAALAVSLLLVLPACVKRASDAEVDQMCQRLVQLHPEWTTAEEQNTELEGCRAEANHNRPFKRVADCRIGAADLDTYWNRCR
jgi:hypothetical protein